METKIGVCIHVSEAITPAAYFNHIGAIQYWSNKYPVVVLGIQRFKVAMARKRLCDEAIKNGCTHALFLDSDHIVADNMLEVLMENKDAAMVSGLICKRLHPYTIVAFILTNEGDLVDSHLKPNTGVHEVAVCAMGCTLINLELIQKLKKPWWHDEHFRSDINLGLKFQNELGAKILVDTRVVTGHLGDPPVIFPGHVDTIRAYGIRELMHELEKTES